MSTPTFLSLPAELRNKVYGYLSPVYGYTKDNVRFLLSCKQVDYEYEAETAHQMKMLIDPIKNEWPSIFSVPIQISDTDTIAQQQVLTLRIPRSMYPGEGGRGDTNCLPRCLGPVFLIHLAYLEVGLFGDPAAAAPPKYGYGDLTNGITYVVPYTLMRHLQCLVGLKLALNEPPPPDINLDSRFYFIDGGIVRAKTFLFSFGTRVADEAKGIIHRFMNRDIIGGSFHETRIVGPEAGMKFVRREEDCSGS
jgi:hypothetical protein